MRYSPKIKSTTSLFDSSVRSPRPYSSEYLFSTSGFKPAEPPHDPPHCHLAHRPLTVRSSWRTALSCPALFTCHYTKADA